LGNFNITVTNGDCRDSEGHLAGSTLTLDCAVNKIMEAGTSQPEGSITLAQALAMASSQPSARLALSSKGVLTPGADADILVLTPTPDPLVGARFTVERVMARGTWVE
jgi:N-acetylglucosamine-6-phosphate deacetylase